MEDFSLESLCAPASDDSIYHWFLGNTYHLSIGQGDIAAEVLGYLLYGNQIVTDVDGDGTYDAGDGDNIAQVNYAATDTTTYYYDVDASGTVTQYYIVGQ